MLGEQVVLVGGIHGNQIGVVDFGENAFLNDYVASRLLPRGFLASLRIIFRELVEDTTRRSPFRTILAADVILRFTRVQD